MNYSKQFSLLYPVVGENQQLLKLAQVFRQRSLNQLFKEDPNRFAGYSVQLDRLLLDYSKHRVDHSVLDQLFQLAERHQLRQWINRLFSEQAINHTEQRPAMHWALRLPQSGSQYPALAQQVHAQLQHMYQLVEKIHAGQYRGATGEVIRDVVNIGVGGSDLGPHMVTYALGDFKVQTAKPLKIRFVSTMDGSQLSDLLHQLRPESTLFVISSKSFSTIDTLSNAQTARLWLEKALGGHPHILKNHFIAVSACPEKMTAWGIAPENQLLLWDWVGGVIPCGPALAYPLH